MKVLLVVDPPAEFSYKFIWKSISGAISPKKECGSSLWINRYDKLSGSMAEIDWLFFMKLLCEMVDSFLESPSFVLLREEFAFIFDENDGIMCEISSEMLNEDMFR